MLKNLLSSLKSHSVWSAWIEISTRLYDHKYNTVALRLECVDRNSLKRLLIVLPSVALRLECVDRNENLLFSSQPINVALRLECVDRNHVLKILNPETCGRTPFGVRG